MLTATHLDACPVCPPGVPDASPSIGAPERIPGGTVTDHQCGTCETAWSTLWRDGWPVDRLIAVVAPDDAELHRGVLAEALAEHGREVRHAVA